MNKKIKKLITAVLLIGLVVGAAGSVKSMWEKQKAAETYAAAQQLARLDNVKTESYSLSKKEYIDPVVKQLETTDLAALREVNPDVIGWITIPDSELSYPLLQGETNTSYIYHTWDKWWNIAGSIYIESEAKADLSEFNTLIYGHRMPDDSMFGLLKHYDDIEFWKKHPSIYIVDDSGAHRYDIFGCHQADTEAIVFRLGISGRHMKEKFIKYSLDNSMIDTGIVPNTLDKIITLATCPEQGYETRLIVQAVQRDGVAPPFV